MNFLNALVILECNTIYKREVNDYKFFHLFLILLLNYPITFQ